MILHAQSILISKRKQPESYHASQGDLEVNISPGSIEPRLIYLLTGMGVIRSYLYDYIMIDNYGEQEQGFALADEP
ncbi:hypothetical protein A3842_09090 [Paenibacillus sp. P3E]|nr:hypothetical protein A3842_09090 [Paenibacillus sp. P3E]